QRVPAAGDQGGEVPQREREPTSRTQAGGVRDLDIGAEVDRLLADLDGLRLAPIHLLFLVARPGRAAVTVDQPHQAHPGTARRAAGHEPDLVARRAGDLVGIAFEADAGNRRAVGLALGHETRLPGADRRRILAVTPAPRRSR